MNILKEIKERVSMYDVLQEYGFSPTRSTIYKCMYHDDDKPSGSVKNDKFHCFACGVTKDIFDFVKDQEKCDLNTAIKIIYDKFGLGLLRHLTAKERQEMALQQQVRDKEKAEKQWWKDFERKVCDIILDNKDFYEKIKNTSHITRGEYRRVMANLKNTSVDEWECSETYFMALKKIKWLDWLYNAINEFNHELCEYDFKYGNDKQEILKKIQSGEIVI
ncbi:MAG: CHC2 zinc finger domain-containing protein [Christensenellales bacterium]